MEALVTHRLKGQRHKEGLVIKIYLFPEARVIGLSAMISGTANMQKTVISVIFLKGHRNSCADYNLLINS